MTVSFVYIVHHSRDTNQLATDWLAGRRELLFGSYYRCFDDHCDYETKEKTSTEVSSKERQAGDERAWTSCRW